MVVQIFASTSTLLQLKIEHQIMESCIEYKPCTPFEEKKTSEKKFSKLALTQQGRTKVNKKKAKP